MNDNIIQNEKVVKVEIVKKWYQRKIIIIPLALIALALVFGGGNKSAKVGETSSSSKTGQAANDLKDMYKVGDIIKVGDFEVIVSSIEKNIPSGNQFIVPKSGNMFVNVNLTIKNNGQNKENVSTLLNMYLKNSEGEKGTTRIFGNDKPIDGELLKGDIIKGSVGYEIAANSNGLKFYYNPSFLFGKSIIVSE